MSTTLATYYAKIQDAPEKEYKVEILEDGPIKRISIDGIIYDVDYNLGGDTIHSIIINNRSYGMQMSANSPSSYEIQHRGEYFHVDIKGEYDRVRGAHSIAVGGRQIVTAPMPGVILKTYVKNEDRVKKGDPLCVLVAMKMENEIRAATEGIVKEIFVEENTKVALNDKIMVIE